MKIVIQRLKNLLTWSDRLGSDEKDEIKLLIKMLEENDNKINKTLE